MQVVQCNYIQSRVAAIVFILRKENFIQKNLDLTRIFCKKSLELEILQETSRFQENRISHHKTSLETKNFRKNLSSFFI